MSEVDLPLLQAQVIVQGLLLQAIAKAVPDPQEVRNAFVEELRKLLPTLPADTMSFVVIQAERLLRQIPKPAGSPPDSPILRPR